MDWCLAKKRSLREGFGGFEKKDRGTMCDELRWAEILGEAWTA